MATIDMEAREALDARRRTLIQLHAPTAGAPDARWRDYDAFPALRSEEEDQELEEIEAALLRIAQGRYGLCLGCGECIPAERLRAVPECRYCATCAGERPEQ